MLFNCEQTIKSMDIPKRFAAAFAKDVVDRATEVELLKAQIKAFSDKNIGYVAYCQAIDSSGNTVCNNWRVHSYQFSVGNEEEYFKYCDTCTWCFCDKHMETEQLCKGCASTDPA